MTKHKFLYAERYAVWQYHDCICYWCSEPLRLQETTIDHFIPEYLEQHPTQLDEVRTLFKLPQDEDIQILEREVHLRIDPQRWRILKMDADRELAMVSDGKTGGITPVGQNPHISWWYPNCWYYGPWNGIYCLNCGCRSDPTD
jgi:hypothetical protein